MDKTFNILGSNTIDENYQKGLIPQRNNKKLFYSTISCRSNLLNLTLLSHHRRLLRKTSNLSFLRIPLSQFFYDQITQKQCHDWAKSLGWNFPTSSIKTIFTNHIFNTLYIWKNSDKQIIAYCICYFSQNISHGAYIFYDPTYYQKSLPLRAVLQTIIDSHKLKLKYCYLGSFGDEHTTYKRLLPNMEIFYNQRWISYNQYKSQLLLLNK